jgi:hypothetical protein
MTALIPALAAFLGAAIGFFAAALLASARRADDCRECRREELDRAFREVDSFGGTDE